MLYSAIICLRTAENKPPPSTRWFTSYVKQNKVFKPVRTKPISRLRFESYSMQDIEIWHKDLRAVIEKHDIQPENIYNFDETGIRMGCISGEEVIVPRSSTAVYTASPENRRSISIIEIISAAGKTIPPVLIIQAKLYMEAWYYKKL